ncbi:MAG: rhodanese-like domain-containing protein, partial [Thermoanaerobaculia bacterium]|nr:rhodanese-like domain-containing protein [Thermoanaerobaculia bacterium]
MLRRIARWLPFGTVPELSAEDLVAMLSSDEPPQLVDVRTKREFERCHIAGSQSVPIHRLPRKIDR